VAICPSKKDQKGSLIEDENDEDGSGGMPTFTNPLRRNNAGVLFSDVNAIPTDYCVAESSYGCVVDELSGERKGVWL
jgi:hypothetical protein